MADSISPSWLESDRGKVGTGLVRAEGAAVAVSHERPLQTIEDRLFGDCERVPAILLKGRLVR